MTTVLYISPHLDDVALSCAGRLLSDVAAGARVVVATLFTHGAGAGHAERRREDRAALERAGVEALHLGLLDAPDRLRRSLTFRSLLLGAPPADDDIERSRRAVAPALDAVAPDRTWWPLGVGGHVDHLVAHACHPLVGGDARFYLDRPYDFVPALRALRRLQIEGGRPGAAPGTDDPGAAPGIDRQLREARVLDRMFARGERDACVQELARRLVSGDEATAPVTGRTLMIEDASLPRSLLRAAAVLIGGYASQLRWLLPPGETVEAAYDRLAGRADGWSEPTARIERRAQRDRSKSHIAVKPSGGQLNGIG